MPSHHPDSGTREPFRSCSRVSKAVYNLGDRCLTDATHVLEQADGGWTVYFMERGIRSETSNDGISPGVPSVAARQGRWVATARGRADHSVFINRH